jgi:hypothetical protein
MRCYLRVSMFGRWILIHPDDSDLAWSGSTWVRHDCGIPVGRAQVCNFETSVEATDYAREHGLEVLGN